jgi:Bacterial Ig domain
MDYRKITNTTVLSGLNKKTVETRSAVFLFSNSALQYATVFAIALFASMYFSETARAQTIITATSSVTITATVVAPGGGSTGGGGGSTGGGGGGGGGSSPLTTTGVTFGGKGTPGTTIEVRVRGVIVGSGTVNSRGFFQVTVPSQTGVQTFSLVARDGAGHFSAVQNFSVVVTANVVTSIAGVTMGPLSGVGVVGATFGRGDYNKDGRIDLVDFSILTFWYKAPTGAPGNIDLNGDRILDLVDFSILAFNWTG